MSLYEPKSLNSSYEFLLGYTMTLIAIRSMMVLLYLEKCVFSIWKRMILQYQYSDYDASELA